MIFYMKEQNNISTVTRRNIADELTVANIFYHGRINEPDFLIRIFDLRNLPSTDHRFNNAYDDISKHMVYNNDWDPDWIFSDGRFNLMHCDDNTFLRFLAETIHPSVRGNREEVNKLLEIYNKSLEPDGYEIIQTSEISGRPVFTGRKIIIGDSNLISKRSEITRYLNSEYVNKKINLMNGAVNTNTDLAIGTAKELLETVCKSILKKYSIIVDPDWSLGRLLKETIIVLDFKPKLAVKPEEAEKSIKQILGGMSAIVNGIAELRNAYGSGHGKEFDFVGLEPKYARLIVAVVAEFVIFYLATDGENTVLVE